MAIAALSALNEATASSALFMQEEMLDRPTGRPWHKAKNDANSYPEGARIGNANSAFGPVSPHPYLMINSVESNEVSYSARATSYKGKFGWINRQESYFLAQDTGNYNRGNRSGMGLLNSAPNGPGSMIAFDWAKLAIAYQLEKQGFTRKAG